MSVNILTYMLAASLIQGGMDWKQAVFTVFLGNTIVLVPMLLNSHPGARYGSPVPGARARLVRSAGRKRRRRPARAGRLRMVRHSDLDRRRSHQHPARHSVSRLDTRRARHRHLLPRFLADQSCRDSERHRVHPLPAGHQRAGSAGRRTAAAGLGLSTPPADSAPCSRLRRASRAFRTS